MDRYVGVRGHRNVAKITQALEQCGARVVAHPDPTVAPYEYRIETPQGEELDLVCYAFTANKYGQSKRPKGEHRFQVKYGSEFDRYHSLFIDPTGEKVTLLFGVHHDLDLFVAVDPLVHTPTWFSMSVEFKEDDLMEAVRVGWHGWERERTSARRKREMPLVDFRTEAVCAFRSELFLRYVQFERVASGLDPGERLLLADRIARRIETPSRKTLTHPLEQALGLEARELLDVLGGSFRLLVAVRGRVAEHHLGEYLRKVPGVTKVEHIDEDAKADFKIIYDRRPFRIECKNVLRKTTAQGLPRVDFQKTRAAKGDPCSRYYSPEQFEVLAACLHPVTEQWDFRFSATGTLPLHKKCPGRLSDKVIVADNGWRDILPPVLDSVLRSGRR